MRPTTSVTKVRDAATFAASLSSKQLHCRELGHEWRDHTVQWDRRAKCYERSLICKQCRSIRRQVLDSRGGVITNGYKYVDGYLANNVEDRSGLSRDVFRLEALTRWLDEHTSKAG